MRLVYLLAVPFLATTLGAGFGVAAEGFAPLAAVDGLGKRIYPNTPAEVIATKAQTAGQFGVLMLYDQPASGPGKDTITQDISATTLVVVEGQYRFFVGEAVFEGGPGTTVVVPAGVKHGWVNIGDKLGKVLSVFTPGGAEQDLIDWDASNTPSPARKTAIDKAYGLAPAKP